MPKRSRSRSPSPLLKMLLLFAAAAATASPKVSRELSDIDDKDDTDVRLGYGLNFAGIVTQPDVVNSLTTPTEEPQESSGVSGSIEIVSQMRQDIVQLRRRLNFTGPVEKQDPLSVQVQEYQEHCRKLLSGPGLEKMVKERLRGKRLRGSLGAAVYRSREKSWVALGSNGGIHQATVAFGEDQGAIIPPELYGEMIRKYFFESTGMYHYMPAAYFLIEKGQLELFKVLLDEAKKAGKLEEILNYVDLEGLTLALFAAERGSLEFLTVLIGYGDTSFRDWSGRAETPVPKTSATDEWGALVTLAGVVAFLATSAVDLGSIRDAVMRCCGVTPRPSRGVSPTAVGAEAILGGGGEAPFDPIDVSSLESTEPLAAAAPEPEAVARGADVPPPSVTYAHAGAAAAAAAAPETAARRRALESTRQNQALKKQREALVVEIDAIFESMKGNSTAIKEVNLELNKRGFKKLNRGEGPGSFTLKQLLDARGIVLKVWKKHNPDREWGVAVAASGSRAATAFAPARCSRSTNSGAAAAASAPLSEVEKKAEQEARLAEIAGGGLTGAGITGVGAFAESGAAGAISGGFAMTL